MGHFGSNLYWDLCSGSLSPPTHHPATASKIGPTHESAPSSQKTGAVQGYLNVSITALLECGPELYQTPVPGKLTTVEHTQGSCLVQAPGPPRQTVQRLSVALGTNLNSHPTMLHTGRRAELAFEGTRLDLCSSVLK